MRRHKGSDETIAWPGLVDFFSLGMVIMLVLFVVAFSQAKNLQRRVEQAEQWVTRVRAELRKIADLLGKEGEEVPFRAEDLRVPGDGAPRLEIGTFGGRKVKFKVGRYELSRSDEETLRKAARVIKEVLGSGEWKQATYFVEIRGEADPRPYPPGRKDPPRNNRELSALRAAEVARVLLDGGVGGNRLRIVGLGVQGPKKEAKPRPGEDEDDVNRRLEKYRTVQINIVPEARVPGRGGAPER